MHQGRGPVERRLFELATQDEIDKLRTNDGSESKNSDEELQLDDLEVQIILEYRNYITKITRILTKPCI